MRNPEQMIKRQRILADFGEFALRSDDLDDVLSEACRLVGEALDTGRAKILEIQQDPVCLLVRAGVGWQPDIVGRMRLPMDEETSETFSIKAGMPVISQDINKEDRFGVPDFMKEAGVVALVNVPIFLPGGRAYGLLQVDSREPRDFGQEDTEFLRTYAIILGPVIDRLHKVQDLQATRERFRLIVENARDYAIFVSDAQDRIIDWLPGAEAVFGWTADEAVGQPSSILFTPEDRERHEAEKEADTARKQGTAPNVRWHVRKDGSRVFIEGSVTALLEGDRLRGFLRIGQDVTERRRVEERQRVMIEGIPQLVWRAGDGGRWRWSSPQWSAYTGLSDEESHELGWLQALHPDDRDHAMAAWREAGTKGVFEAECRICHVGDRLYRWFQTRALPVRDGERQVAEWLGTSTDIDDLRRMHEQQAVLVAELQHRTRNLLTMVRSIAARSFPPSPARDEYEGRLAALGRVQGFLSRAPHWSVPLADLIGAELKAVGGGASERVKVEGPPIELPGSIVQVVALALHELATNAAKHGAIVQPSARLAVTWHLEGADHTRRLVLEWRERGVTMPAGPPAQRGYGSELIERALPYQLKAKTKLEFGQDGVSCTIALPVGTFEVK